ncbi:MAG: hypothetical protein QOE45_3166 [Frankiaceae bacterium]|nr:hypothetical protein [Frankiaceae bacterium]
MGRKFSVRPALTVKGRTYKGLRGFAGKPFHPPLTDIPVAAYVFAALFDLGSWVSGNHRPRGLFLNHAATYVLVVGALVSLLAMLTGWADWHRSSQVGTQARRTINTHAVIMIATSVIVLVDIAVRVRVDDTHAHTTPFVAVLSVLAALLVSTGSTYGGSLVFDYGFNVETSGDHPVWHESETDVFPGHEGPGAT